MSEPLSIHEVRRRAPLHYWAKADNARYAAYLLSLGSQSQLLAEAASNCDYGGSPSIAVGEAFRREAAIALELIIKGVIAAKIQRKTAPAHVVRVRPTHDLSKLWADASLPKLSLESQRLLLRAKSVLYWSGRYAAPKTDDDILKEIAEEDALIGSAGGSPVIKVGIIFDWGKFDAIYQIALTEFRAATSDSYSV